jgi:hypothetical protein
VENCTALVEDTDGRLRLIWPTAGNHSDITHHRCMSK